jgi:hypothetical protein
MPEISITLEDDIAEEQEYDIHFLMTSSPVRAHYGDLSNPGWPAEPAEFEVVEIRDAYGREVTGDEFDAVWEAACDANYEDMVEAAMAREVQ